jgi:two-component system LytT family response regulator
MTLKTIERKLDPGRFARVHRSTIVNLDAVRELAAGEVVLRDGTRLPVSRRSPLILPSSPQNSSGGAARG